MTPLAQALRRAAPLRPAPRATVSGTTAPRATDARATDLLSTDQQVPIAPASEYAPSTDHNPPAPQVPATQVPVSPAPASRASGSQPSAEQPLRSTEPTRLSPVGGNSLVAAAAAPCGLAAQHLADWQRATQARRVLVLATRPDPRCQQLLASLARQLATLTPARIQPLPLATAASDTATFGTAPADASLSPTDRTAPTPGSDGPGHVVTLLDGTACSLAELAPWLVSGVVDGLLEIHPAQSGSAPPAWECLRLAADIPLVGVVEIRSSPHPGSPRVACT